MVEKKIPSVLKSVRLKCLDCVCGSANEIKLCPCEDCALYPFRFGKNPNKTGVTKPKKPMTEEHKAALMAGLKKSREAKKKANETAK